MIKIAKIGFLADNAFPFDVIGNHVPHRPNPGYGAEKGHQIKC